ncbi:MAG: long-chain acyl-CoA synthetase [Acidimicrobiia bacterium]|nr:MAG: long-chain acyl-CoA synthetase [Acidimicrobiia bacterium]
MGDPGPLGPSAHARANPDRPAFVERGRTVTYGEFDARSDRIAAALAARGVAPGERVAIMLPNSVGFFEAWAAATKLQASVVLVNTHLKPDEVRYILDDSGAKVLLDDPDAVEAMATGAPPAGADLVPCEVLAAPVFYTSGTTGRPKGVVHGAFDGDRARLAQQGQVALWGWTADDVYLLSGPAYHAGPGGFVMSALYVGATTVVLPRWDAREWLALVDRHRVTLSFMTPAHFIRILEVPPEERARHDTSSLRLVVHGAAPCPVEVKRRIIEALPHTEIWELYGASEGGATRISPQEWLERPGSVGLPWPGVEIRVLGDDGEPLPPGEPGLVYVRPAGGARFHYHGDEAKTAQAWRDDAFTVGDIGYLDADGYLYLTDRASDMVIRGGVNVYPREIEEVLYRHPAVVDCAVFGVPDERYGEQLRAVVEVRSPVDPAALQAHVRAHLADFKVPAEVEIVDELPRNPNGKVMKRWLRERAWEGRDRRIG